MTVDTNTNTGKHRQSETDEAIEAEGEAQVKYLCINIADAVDNRPLKDLLFHQNCLPRGLREYNL